MVDAACLSSLWCRPGLDRMLDLAGSAVFVRPMHVRPSCLAALLLAVLVAASGGAVAQPGPSPRPAAGAAVPAAAQGLPPQQAQQALDVLRDDKRRAELIATLEAVAKAGASTPGASTPGAEPASKLPLEPDSLGAQLVNQVSAGLSEAGAQFMASARAVNDLPLLWGWLVSQGSDAAARDLALDAGWKLVVVGLGALGVEWAVRLLLRRLRTALSRGAARGMEAPGADVPLHEGSPTDVSGLEAAEAGETERVDERSLRLNRAVAALRRLPFLLGRLVLDLVPIAMFGVVANALLGTRLGMLPTTRGTILLVVQCYVVGRLVLVVSALLVSAATPRLRLLHISDWAAAFLTRWVRRITLIMVSGYALAGIGLQFAMYRTAYDALIKLFALAMHVCLVVAVLQAREPVARRIRARHGATGAWATVLNRVAEIWHLVAIFYIMALWLVWAVELRNGYVRLVHFFMVTAAVTITSRLVAIVLLGGLDRARAWPAVAVRAPGFADRAQAYYPVLRTALMTFIGVATSVALLEVWGFDFLGWFSTNGLGRRSVSALLLIGVTILLAVLVWEGVNSSIELHLVRLSKSAQLARAGRLRTLLPMLRTVLLVTIVLVVALMTLDELGVNIAPLLAGAGVVGIAVGFGSQKLVQDLITGLFLLLENTMQVGDVVTLGGLSGTVEALSIRTIRLRAIDGAVHIIPFSAVTTVTNQTRDYGYAVLDVSIGLNEEPDHIVTVLKEVAETMRQEADWQNIVLEPLDVMGVDKFVDMAWIMRIRLKTQPSSRWAVGRELNRRIKVAFDDQAIESPFTSHRVLSTNPPPPAETPVAEPPASGAPA